MQIITQERTGSAQVLQLSEKPTPEPGPGELRVRVMSAGVNPVDAAVRAGHFPLIGEPPFTIGWDLAGVVEAVGPGVRWYRPGDRVAGLARFPQQAAAYASHAIVPEEEIARVPAQVDLQQAGALPLAGLTAWQALVEAGGLAPRQRVLIHSGAGGVGHLAVQIAKARGAHVTATASAGKLDLLRELGADIAVDYHRTQPVGPFDLVLDPQAGVQAETSVALTRPGGRVITLLDFTETAAQLAQSRGVHLQRIMVRPGAHHMAALMTLMAEGALRVVVDRTFPLAEAGAAQDYLAEARPAGKVALIP
ncbi:NADP-dependent oxidoreductase [Pseudooceanicola nanhaiensis]|uniref:NADP-dependent oxidoreductase n=1 Tax=Pseudooceanicola nanhaiensis TaxID=375761 RepID=UPI001CD3C356|nr:NADP-dependent oxidoreductase [Pseudooceanicola nanhaiensis]MCA0921866.1 NADP-dependent oxidoreductase [Pseudooceanicola nanhaiensis]